MTDIKRLLGTNVKNYRTTLGVSQSKLAEIMSIAPNYLGLIEGGKKFPSAEMIERLAGALGKDTADLFAPAPLHEDWKERILRDIEALISERLRELRRGPPAARAGPGPAPQPVSGDGTGFPAA